MSPYHRRIAIGKIRDKIRLRGKGWTNDIGFGCCSYRERHNCWLFQSVYATAFRKFNNLNALKEKVMESNGIEDGLSDSGEDCVSTTSLTKLLSADSFAAVVCGW